MKVAQLIALAACMLVGSGAVNAGTGTVNQTLDYRNDAGNNWYFWAPNTIVDHMPYQRQCWEDWGWTHDVGSLLPTDVVSIDGATLSILAWGVDDTNEADIIYVNGVQVGTLQGPSNGVPVPPVPPEMSKIPGQPCNALTAWSMTKFTLPPAVLQELLQDRKVEVFMDIDVPVNGTRVTIRSSTLTVNYTASGSGGGNNNGGGDSSTEPNVAVYRFWSPVLSGHFYTISEDEKNNLIAQYPDVWTYEGVAYHTFGAPLNDNLRPVYRFWSGQAHFYTISEDEKNNLIAQYAYVWTYEGIAFYAYPEGLQPSDAKPVYRFWSPRLSKHFYTISEEEKQNIVDQYSYTWGLEGVAWYAYE
jgi:hypothetical protein